MRLSLFVLTLIMTANALNDTCRNVVYHVQNLKQDVKQVTTLFIIIHIGFGAGGGQGGGRPPPPTFWPGGGARGAHHFELQPLVCIVCSGKVITLRQQCITQVTKVTTNSQQDPKY